MTESEERRTLEIAISAVLHRVVEEVREVVGRTIEGDWEFTRRIVVAEEHIGKSRSSRLATIPCLHNSIAVLTLRNECHGTTRTVDEHHALAHLVQTSHHVALHLWKFDAGAVATLESWGVHFHFLTFETWRDASHEHHHIGIVALAHHLVNIHVAMVINIQFEESKPRGLSIIHLERIILACLHLDFVGIFSRAMLIPTSHECIAIENDTTKVLEIHVDDDGFGLVGMVSCSVASTEVLEIHTLSKGGVATIDEGNRCCVANIGNRISLRGCGIPIATTQTTGAIGLTEAGETTFQQDITRVSTSSHVSHLGTLLLNALENADSGSRCAIVVAPQHGGIGSIRSHHHNFLPRLLKRQHTIILHQHHRLTSCIERQLLMLF